MSLHLACKAGVRHLREGKGFRCMGAERDGNPPHFCLAHAHAPTIQSLSLSNACHEGLICWCIRILRYISLPSVHPRRDYDVKLTRLSTFFLFGPLTTLMVFTCFRCDVANYHRKLKFDELVTVCRQNMQEIITLFFWQVLIISSPSCLE